jgi:hypothetical protein
VEGIGSSFQFTVVVGNCDSITAASSSMRLPSATSLPGDRVHYLRADEPSQMQIRVPGPEVERPLSAEASTNAMPRFPRPRVLLVEDNKVRTDASTAHLPMFCLLGTAANDYHGASVLWTSQ